MELNPEFLDILSDDAAEILEENQEEIEEIIGIFVQCVLQDTIEDLEENCLATEEELKKLSIEATPEEISNL